MKLYTLLFICWWNVCCSTPKKPEQLVYNQTVLVVVRNEQKEPTWLESAAATFRPLTGMLTWAFHQVVP